MDKSETGSPPIIAVYTTYVDRPVLLGYATGESEDIAAYFEGRKVYGLEMKEVEPVAVPRGYAEQRQHLLSEKKRLERELDEINVKIKKRSANRVSECCDVEECGGECMDYLSSAPVGSKHHKKDRIGRPGRNYRAELNYRGNSSMAPRKTHDGKGKTLRDKRP